MGIRKGTNHHQTDVQGTPDEWVRRQLADLRNIARRQNADWDAFAENTAEIRRNGSVRGEKKG